MSNESKTFIMLVLLTLGFLVDVLHIGAAPDVERYGIICGVADYQYISDLDYTDDDAIEMKDALDEICWEHLTLLIDMAASKAEIQSAIQGLVGIADADAIVLFYFAGHGTYGDDIPPIDEVDGEDEYICPWDSGIDPGTNIRDDELEAWLDALPSKKVVILDTCYSGGYIKGDDMTTRTLPDRPRVTLEDAFARDLDKAGYVVLAACDDNELSYEDSALGHGIFTYYLLMGMRCLMLPADTDGDKWVSAEEEFFFAAPRTTAFESTQHPQLYDDDVGVEVELGFCHIVGGEVMPVNKMTLIAPLAQRFAVSLLAFIAVAMLLLVRTQPH